MIRGNQLDPKKGLHVELERNIICHEKDDSMEEADKGWKIFD